MKKTIATSLRVLGAAAILGLFGLVGTAQATVMTTTLDVSFGSGGAGGSSFDVIIDDEGTPNSVKLTFDLTNLTQFGGTKVTNIFLSYDGPTLTSGDFSVWIGDTPTNIFVCATTQPCTDVAFKADGDGIFDLLFEFPTSGNLFGPGEMTMATITLAGITVADFIGLSNITGPGSGGSGPFCMAAHVQSGQNEMSDFLGAATCMEDPGFEVPEPASLLLFGIGLLGLGVFVRRRRFAA